jgi:hypothetical protein
MNQEHKEFLDNLRESGEVNMFGAAVLLREEFDLDKPDSQEILSEWMETFE